VRTSRPVHAVLGAICLGPHDPSASQLRFV
jgi:hypothetical protein